MIKVVITEREGKFGLKMTGHAEYSEKGKDIVCASASMLAYTLAQNVLDLDESSFLEKKPTITLKDGNAKVVCQPKGDQYYQCKYLYQIIMQGFHLLALNYPDNVSVKVLGEA